LRKGRLRGVTLSISSARTLWTSNNTSWFQNRITSISWTFRYSERVESYSLFSHWLCCPPSNFTASFRVDSKSLKYKDRCCIVEKISYHRAACFVSVPRGPSPPRFDCASILVGVALMLDHSARIS
jgi:hypothetical protein